MTNPGWLLGLFAIASFGAAQDPWQKKDHADWSVEELRQIASKSPWSKSVSILMKIDSASLAHGSGIDPANGPSYGTRPSVPGAVAVTGVSGSGSTDPYGRNSTEPGKSAEAVLAESVRSHGAKRVDQVPRSGRIAVVRWESSPLIREVLARTETDDYNDQVADFAKQFYVISVTAGTVTPGGEKFPLHWMTESLEPPDAPRDSPDPEVREFWDKTMPASMIATTFLKNGSSKIKPAHVVFVSSSPSLVTMFLFSRSLALERNSKGLSFESSIGRLSLKATFELKDMIQADGAGL